MDATLFQYTRQGLLNKLKSAYRKDPTIIHAREADGNTLLHIAAATAREEIVAWLLEKGADPNAMNHEGKTPLHEAVSSLGSGSTALILANGSRTRAVRVNARDTYGSTPLHYATPDNALLLLRHGASVDTRNLAGKTPLHYAVQSGDQATVRILSEHGANVNAADNEQNTPLFYVGQDGYIAQTLLRAGANPNRVNRQTGLSVLQHTIQNLPHEGEYSDHVLRALLEHGADPNLFENVEQSPLWMIIEPTQDRLGEGWTWQTNAPWVAHAIKLLLDHGANPDIMLDHTPLTHYVIEDMYVLEIMLLAGTDPNASDEFGNTLMHDAPSPAHALLLLENGADPNRANWEGYTPLVYALNDREYTFLLLDWGATITPQVIEYDRHGYVAAWERYRRNVASELERVAHGQYGMGDVARSIYYTMYPRRR